MAKKQTHTPKPKPSPKPGSGTDKGTRIGPVEEGYRVPKPPKPGPSKSK